MLHAHYAIRSTGGPRNSILGPIDCAALAAVAPAVAFTALHDNVDDNNNTIAHRVDAQLRILYIICPIYIACYIINAATLKLAGASGLV